MAAHRARMQAPGRAHAHLIGDAALDRVALLEVAVGVAVEVDEDALAEPAELDVLLPELGAAEPAAVLDAEDVADLRAATRHARGRVLDQSNQRCSVPRAHRDSVPRPVSWLLSPSESLLTRRWRRSQVQCSIFYSHDATSHASSREETYYRRGPDAFGGLWAIYWRGRRDNRRY